MTTLPTYRRMHDIFVYGTLRPGNGNARLWAGRADARHDGVAHVLGYRLVTNGGFPYMLQSATSQTVGTLIVPHEGEYDRVLAAMDALEGYRPGSEHNHYERIRVPVMTPGWITYAWTYVPAWDHGDLPEVPTNEDGFFDWACQPRRRSLI